MYIIIIIINNRPCLTRRSGPFPRALAPCGPGIWCPRKEAGARGKPGLALAARILVLQLCCCLLAPAQVVRQVPLHAKRFAAAVADVRPAHHALCADVALQAGDAGKANVLLHSVARAEDGVALPLSLSTAWVCLLASLLGHSLAASPCLSP